MENENYVKGVLFGLCGVVLIGLQPIVANARPAYIDSYIFAAMTVSIEALLFLPIMLLERRQMRAKLENGSIAMGSEAAAEIESRLHGWKEGKNRLLIVYVGLTFAIAQVLFFIGYQEAGAINGSLAQKTTVMFGLLFGYLINKERIRPAQIIFSAVMLFGLALAITQGSFNVLEFNFGVLILLIMAILWMLAHAFTKPIFDRKETTASFMVFTRNAIGGVFLLSTYFLIYPLENAALFWDPAAIGFFVLMGLNYASGLYCWYQVLSILGTSKGTALVSGTPIITALFATLILGEVFTIYHLIGMLIVIVSVIVIVKPTKEEEPEINTEGL